jgi:hypothetical protein
VTRALATAVVAAVALVAAGCAGDDATRVTLTNDTCSYDGPETVDAGTVSLELQNESDANGVFELLRLGPSTTFEQLDAHVDAEQQRIDAGQRPLGPPDTVTVVLPLEVDPGQVGELSSSLVAATYAVTCADGSPATALYVTEPFEVE